MLALNSTVHIGEMTMSSLELVGFVNACRQERAHAAGARFPSPGFAKLEHYDFLKKVPEVLGKEHAGKFSCMFDTPVGNGAKRQSPGYRFPKREAVLLAMTFGYFVQSRIYDHLTEMEQQLPQAVPALPDFSNPAVAARAWAEQFEQREQLALVNKAQAEALALAAPKLDFVDKYVQASTGSKGFREVCKLLKVKERIFRRFLEDARVMYVLNGEWVPYACHLDAGRFDIKAGVADHGETSHAFNQAKFTAAGVTWIAGEWGKHQALLAQNKEVGYV